MGFLSRDSEAVSMKADHKHMVKGQECVKGYPEHRLDKGLSKSSGELATRTSSQSAFCATTCFAKRTHGEKHAKILKLLDSAIELKRQNVKNSAIYALYF